MRFVVVVTVLAIAAAGCNGRPQALPNVDSLAANEMGLESAGLGDDWTTFAHDYRRSGYNPVVGQPTRLTVSKLRLRWKEHIGDEIFASPVTYAGNLIVVSEGAKKGAPGSVVYNLRASDGHVLWKFTMGAFGQMTPTIDPDAGLVIVANEHKEQRKKTSYVFALRLLDGSLAWRLPVQALLRAAPVATGGRAYIGTAGGDPPGCVQGGITAIDESTGKVVWTWSVDPQQHEGGSVWGAIAYDGSHLIFGTGNTCQTPITTANGAVSLSLDGKPVWNMVAVKDSYYDSDTGGGVMLFHGLAHFINKNGEFYAVNQETGNIAWTTDLNPYAGGRGNWNGGFTTATTDGNTIVEGSGLYADSNLPNAGEFCLVATAKPGEVFAGFHSKLEGMNLNGHVLWSRTMQNRLVGYVALAHGLGFVGLNKDFVAVDLSTGQTRWSYPAGNYIDASMIVVASGVYGADDGGNVYAFALPSDKSTATHLR